MSMLYLSFVPELPPPSRCVITSMQALTERHCRADIKPVQQRFWMGVRWCPWSSGGLTSVLPQILCGQSSA